ncbi:MAG TPA: DUF5915 domain-containing protein, partial [Pilimelia sp.]|nr:DUF5915 domain-containing protein [Pilimelia sp.]
VAEELNVRALEPLHGAGEIVDFTVKPNFRHLGRRFGGRTQHVATAIRAADPAALAAAVGDGGTGTVVVDGEPVPVTGEDVQVTQAPRSGWAVASQRDVTIALDTEITPELRAAGLAREVVRTLQEARKQAGLEITDRIVLAWHASDDALAEAVRTHVAEIAEAVLATAVSESPDAATAAPDLPLRYTVRRA